MMMDGFEESETVQVTDLLRRAGIQADTFRFQEDPYVEGMQKIKVKADAVFDPETVMSYDCLIVPGGRTCAEKFIGNEAFMNTLKACNEKGRLIAGMCSGTRVLEAAGVLKGRKATGYTGYEDVLKSAVFVEMPAVHDGNVVTSVGPATPYPFAFAIIEALGRDTETMKNGLLYNKAGGL